jgi:MFS superfamily sulfate permease-like transporter
MPMTRPFEGLLIVRPEGRFSSPMHRPSPTRSKALVSQHQPRVLAVDLSRVPDVEYSALQALIEADRRAAERGAVVWLAAMNPRVLEVVRHAKLDQRLGRERMLFNARAAIEKYQAMRRS